MYKVTVNVTLRESILDPQGKAAHQSLQKLGMHNIKDVRIGKLIELNIEADSQDRARAAAEDACSQLLANEVMEDYTIEVETMTDTYESTA